MNGPILVTRPASQGDALCTLLASRGIAAVHVPTVAIDFESAADRLDAALGGLSGADWLVVTSANGADAIARRLAASERQLPRSVRVAAVGPATAAALRRDGLRVDHVPETYLTVAIGAGLGDVSGRRVVLARADSASPDLAAALRDRGALVEEVVAYRTVEGPPSSSDDLRRSLAQGVAGVAFTSGSTVRGLMRLASPVDRMRLRSLGAYCIGPVTAAVARQLGFHVAAEAKEHTAAGLADAIAHHLTPEES